MVFIYILQLEDDKYYVGKSNDVDARIAQHFDGFGSEWTKIYPPIAVIEVIEGDEFDEDKYTKIYMKKYGIDHVRGGSYAQVNLSENIIKHIEKELLSSDDRCYICKGNHFAKNCPNKLTCYTCGEVGHTSPQCRFSRKGSMKCHTCGKYGHVSCKQIKCYSCGELGHKSPSCPLRVYNDPDALKRESGCIIN
jgi:predicted GIY-YIG superfamily endonuclease